MNLLLKIKYFIRRNAVIFILFTVFVIATFVLGFTFRAIFSTSETEVAATPVPTMVPTPSPTPVPVTPHPVFSKPETDGGLGPEIFQECEFQGRVETLNYTTTDYANGPEYEKTMRVYLPYGYDETKKYNVMILLHGYGGDELYWFDEIRWYSDPDYCQDYECKLQNVLDNMIANKICDPVIVVSPTYYLNREWKNDVYDDTVRDGFQFRKELRHDILPTLAEKYSTYDVGDRDHFAFIGASNGAAVLYRGVLPYALDLFSYFGAVSGFESTKDEIERIWDEQGYGELDIKYFYASAGEFDFLRHESKSGYMSMLNGTKINENNSKYVKIRQAEHEDIVWIDGVYNCLQLFFKQK